MFINNIENCIILCGGKSSRMRDNKIVKNNKDAKSNKALLKIGDVSLIGYQLLKLESMFKNVFIACKESQKNELNNALQNDYANKNLTLKENLFLLENEETFSPMVGILNSFENLNTQKIFFISCDCPLIKPKTFKILSLNSTDFDITIARDSTRFHPLIGVWDRKVLKKLKEVSKDSKILDFINNFETKAIYFDENEFININTKNDYKIALNFLKG